MAKKQVTLENKEIHEAIVRYCVEEGMLDKTEVVSGCDVTISGQTNGHEARVLVKQARRVKKQELKE